MLGEMSKWCDFNSPSQIITLEAVVNACFLNPYRKKYPFQNRAHGYPDASLCGEEVTPQLIVQRFQKTKHLLNFNALKIDPNDRARIRRDQEETDFWLSELRSSLWYGPYKDGDWIFFKTRSDSDGYSGFNLSLKLSQYIYLEFRDRNNNFCGMDYCSPA